MTSWKHNSCEACWIRRESVWAKDPETGELTLEAILLPVPTIPDVGDRILAGDVEHCCFCTKPTIVGIYVDHDPDGVYFCDHGKET